MSLKEELMTKLGQARAALESEKKLMQASPAKQTGARLVGAIMQKQLGKNRLERIKFKEILVTFFDQLAMELGERGCIYRAYANMEAMVFAIDFFKAHPLLQDKQSIFDLFDRIRSNLIECLEQIQTSLQFTELSSSEYELLQTYMAVTKRLIQNLQPYAPGSVAYVDSRFESSESKGVSMSRLSAAKTASRATAVLPAHAKLFAKLASYMGTLQAGMEPNGMKLKEGAKVVELGLAKLSGVPVSVDPKYASAAAAN